MNFPQPFVLGWAFLALLLLALAAPSTITAARFSYSTSGGQVNGRRILLSPDPDSPHSAPVSLQAYTHYLVPSLPSGVTVPKLGSTNETSYAYAYTFTVQLAESSSSGARRNDTGIFITVSGFSDPKETGKAGASETRPPSEEMYTDMNKVCTNYQITLAYPQDHDKLPVRLCKPNGEFTDSAFDLLTFGDYEGLNGTGSGGSVQVRVERAPRSLYPRVHPLQLYGGIGRGRGREEVGPWRRKGVRAPGAAGSIPAESIGAIVFTVYQNCERASVSSSGARPRLRPCSTLHNLTCIASEVFCDSEPNCVIPFWELFLLARDRNESAMATATATASPEATDATTPTPTPTPHDQDGYDEIPAVCGQPGPFGRPWWERTTTTYTYRGGGGGAGAGAGKLGGGSGSGGGIGIGIGFFLLVTLLSGCCAFLKKYRQADDNTAAAAAGLGPETARLRPHPR